MSTSTAKRSWKHAMADAEAFRDLFPQTAYKRWEFAGSLRRKKPEVGDIEHVIIPRFGDVRGDGLFAEPKTVNLVWFALDALVQVGGVSKHVYGATGFRWGEKYRGVDYRGFNNELFMADADNWGSALAIRTGPADYSRMLVATMQANGYRNRDGYVWYSNSETRVSAPDEETYFKLCGVRFVSPEKRR